MMRTTVTRKTREVHTSTSATNDTTEGGSSLATGSEPHDPEETEHTKLKDEVGCPGAVTEETNNDPKRSIGIFQRHARSGTRLT